MEDRDGRKRVFRLGFGFDFSCNFGVDFGFGLSSGTGFVSAFDLSSGLRLDFRGSASRCRSRGRIDSRLTASCYPTRNRCVLRRRSVGGGGG